MRSVRLALQAMATRFELLMYGSDPVALRAAGEEALREIALLEKQLSFYDPYSEVSRINRDAADRPVRVSARLFSLLQTARACTESTKGAFDITIGPLMRCWGFVRSTGTWPSDQTLNAARAVTGMSLVRLRGAGRTVEFARPGLTIDLGAIGKGFAIEEATMLLRQCGVASALLHGGTSSIGAIGTPPEEPEGWPVGIADPRDPSRNAATIRLRDEAFSVSATWGKAFRHKGTQFGHVIDPRSGQPVRGAALAAVAHSSATWCDALSTGLLILDPNTARSVSDTQDRVRWLTGYRKADGIAYHSQGIDTN
ncbi:MAG: FAD:protein FMN transferase [Bacteroidota bacterium]|nr:FAD:protein FMN transferase [Bacteroidota bacterium]MDE2957658.1 FAD:protein FMN transferase [Bacteroidota bacterium]